jgi:anti-anti-sigma regulatory factor
MTRLFKTGEVTVLSFEESGNTIGCKFRGNLTSVVCSDLEKELNEHIVNFIGLHDNTEIVFNLAETVYVCSAFLHLCLYYCKTAGVRNFRIVNVPPPVMNILNLAGFTEIMTITPAGQKS